MATARRTLWLALLLALAPATAEAVPMVVYTCGPSYANLCRANGDGSGQTAITTDGDAAADRRYGSPSLSADGRLLAYNLSGDLHVRNLQTGADTGAFLQPNAPTVVRMRADGLRVAAGESSSTFTATELCSYNSDRSGTNEGRDCHAGFISGLAWAPAGRLVAAVGGGTANNGRDKICLVMPAEAEQTGCERDVARDPGINLKAPSVSPDGSLIAVTEVADDGIRGNIALFDPSTATRVRVLTSGGADATPAWSADGSLVSFSRGPSGAEDVYVTRADGAPGSERLLARDAREATWAEVAGPPPPVLSGFSARSRQRGSVVRGSVVIGAAGSAFRAELRTGSRVQGRASRRAAPAGRLRFAVKLNSRARRDLRRRGRLRPTLVVRVTPPGGGTPATARKRVVVLR